jgi:hypothetical protein
MKFFQVGYDGGKDSGVTGYWLCEIKWLFSIVLLHFKKGSRENYHSHAFNAYSFFLSGEVEEHLVDGTVKVWKPSLKPKFTHWSTFHKVFALQDTWCLSFRGRWDDYWHEFSPTKKEYILLTHGRKVVKTFDVDYTNITDPW